MNETTQISALGTRVSQSSTTGDVAKTIPLTHLNNGIFILRGIAMDGIYKASTGEVLVQAPCAPGMGQGGTKPEQPTINAIFSQNFREFNIVKYR